MVLQPINKLYRPGKVGGALVSWASIGAEETRTLIDEGIRRVGGYRRRHRQRCGPGLAEILECLNSITGYNLGAGQTHLASRDECRDC